MNHDATIQRDNAQLLAKSEPLKAHLDASMIVEPWFRAQALAWVARFSEGRTIEIAKEAAKAAMECDDSYKRTAVRAWEIAALAEVGATEEASFALNEALRDSRLITPLCSCAEALFLLAQAASKIDSSARDIACDHLMDLCSGDHHWRSKRAVRDSIALRNGTANPRPFFW